MANRKQKRSAKKKSFKLFRAGHNADMHKLDGVTIENLATGVRTKRLIPGILYKKQPFIIIKTKQRMFEISFDVHLSWKGDSTNAKDL